MGRLSNRKRLGIISVSTPKLSCERPHLRHQPPPPHNFTQSMDVLVNEPSVETETTSLSYDDSVPYSELPPPPVEASHSSSSLADRISHTKLYLVSDTVAARTGKVRG